MGTVVLHARRHAPVPAIGGREPGLDDAVDREHGENGQEREKTAGRMIRLLSEPRWKRVMRTGSCNRRAARPPA